MRAALKKYLNRSSRVPYVSRFLRDVGLPRCRLLRGMSSEMGGEEGPDCILEAEAQQVSRLLAWDRKMRTCKGKKRAQIHRTESEPEVCEGTEESASLM